MDQSYLTPNYNINSKLRTEFGNRRKYYLENYITQPPLAKLPQNPNKIAPTTEIIFKIKQFTEYIIYTEFSGLIGDSKGNSFPGITVTKVNKIKIGESQFVELTDRPTKR